MTFFSKGALLGATALLLLPGLTSAAPALTPAPAKISSPAPSPVKAAVAPTLTCDNLQATADSVEGFNTLLAYTCAFEAFRNYSIVLTDKDKLAKFVDLWAPEKWAASDLLKMDGRSDADRIQQTFILISRMRDFTNAQSHRRGFSSGQGRNHLRRLCFQQGDNRLHRAQ